MVEQEWILIQKKTFTKWINTKIEGIIDKKVMDIQKDLTDGTILSYLLISLSGENLNFHKNPSSKFQKIENIQICMNFIKNHNVRLVNIGTEDIYGENLKLILGLIWTLISKFGYRSVYSEFSGDSVLAWCKAVTRGYKNVNVDGFGDCWKDGLAFNAIIHKFRPDLVNFEQLDKNEDKKNLISAFDLAQDNFGIPKLMDPEDFVDVEKIDEKSVYTYVAQYYEKLVEYEKNDTHGKLLGYTQNIAKWSIKSRNNYEAAAKKYFEQKKQLEIRMQETENKINDLITTIKENYIMMTNTRNKYFYLNHLLGSINMVHKENDLKFYNPPGELNVEKQVYKIPIEKYNEKIETLLNELTAYSQTIFGKDPLIINNIDIDMNKISLNKETSDKNNNQINNDGNKINLLNIFKSYEKDLITHRNEIKDIMKYDLKKYEKGLLQERLNLINEIIKNRKLRKKILKDANSLFLEFDKENKKSIKINDYMNIMFMLGLNVMEPECDEVSYDKFIRDVQNCIKPFYQDIIDIQYVDGEDYKKFIDEYVNINK